MLRPLYKSIAPFMEHPSGYGYLGVVMYDDIEDKVQCSICGKWFENLGQHLFMRHKVSADDYKIKNGLTLRTALCGSQYLKRKRDVAMRRINDGTLKPGTASDAARMNRRNKRSNYRYRQNGNQIQSQNKVGLCQEQIKARYFVVKSIVGKTPTQADIIRYDSKLFHCGIVTRFKNLNNFRRSLGEKTRDRGDTPRYGDIVLVGRLRKYAHDNGRLPKSTTFRGTTQIYRRFGSWSNALRVAGLK